MSEVKVKAEKVKLTVNGQEVEVKAGTTILQAARRVGVYIPTLCYLEKLNPIGSCRICSVEVEGVDAPVMSCETPAAEGMVVNTESAALTKYRQNMMKMILVNHPLDCPVCERSGECWLQNRTFELNVTGHAWKTNDHKKVPVVDWGLIQYDENLCIMCKRCIKICREVQGIGAYKIDGTGYSSKINTVTGEKLDCDFCGQCLSVCPVGALSSGMGMSGRSWEYKRIDTICAHCAVGCSLQVNTKNGKIVRITSNTSVGVNDGNMCARGRFGYEFVQSEARLDAPLVRTGTGFKATSWDKALKDIADILAKTKSAHGGKGFVGIGSERATNEDSYAFQKFFREVLGSGNVDTVTNMVNPETGSARFKTFGDFPLTATYDAIEEGNLFVFIGADGSNENPVISNMIRIANRDRGAEVVIAYSREGQFTPAPRLQAPYDYLKLNDFTLGLLASATASIKADGGFEGGVQPDDSFASEVGKTGANGKASDLVRLIRKHGKPVYLVGQEAQRHPNATSIIRNIVNLAKLTGGTIMMLRSYCNSLGAIDMGVTPNSGPGYTETPVKADGDLLSLMENGTAKVLIVMDEDVLLRHDNTARFRDAMKKMDHVVVIDQFFTNTCYEAGHVLPSTTSMEKNGSFTNLEGRCQPLEKAVENVGQARSGWDILGRLAKELGTDFGYATCGDVKADIAKNVPLYASITEGEFAVDYSSLQSANDSLTIVAPGELKTASCDFEILQDHSIFGSGVYTDMCPSIRPLLGKPYADFHLKGVTDVMVNPADAAKIEAKEGDDVVLKFASEEVRGKLKLDPRVTAGSLRVSDDVDKSPIEAVLINGKDYSAVNLAALRG